MMKSNDKNIAIDEEPKIGLIDDDAFERDAYIDPSKKFYFDSKGFFLTYPQYDISPKEFFEKFKARMLENNKEVKMAIVSSEDHKSTQGKHIHMYGEFGVRLCTRNMYYFDIDGHHPNVQRPKHKIKCIKYVAGYTLKKKDDKKDYYCYNLDLSLYLEAKQEHKAYLVKKVLDKEMTFDEWVDQDPNSVFRLKSLVQNVQLYWSFKSQKVFPGKRYCFWLYGKPGIGKSYSVRKMFPGLYLKESNKWWDGYVDQSVVLLDDLDGNVLSHHLKIWGDNYQFSGEIKGSTVECIYSVFFITSNYTMEYLFGKKVDEDDEEVDIMMKDQLLAAIKRRYIFIRCAEYLDDDGYFDLHLALAGYENELNSVLNISK